MDPKTKRDIESMVVGDIILIKLKDNNTLILKKQTEKVIDIYYNSHYYDCVDISNDGEYAYSDKLISVIKNNIKTPL